MTLVLAIVLLVFPLLVLVLALVRVLFPVLVPVPRLVLVRVLAPAVALVVVPLTSCWAWPLWLRALASLPLHPVGPLWLVALAPLC